MTTPNILKIFEILFILMFLCSAATNYIEIILSSVQDICVLRLFLNLPLETLRWKSKRYGIHCSLWLTLTFMICMCHKAVYKCLHSRLLLISYSNVALNHWFCGNHSRSQYFPICDNESLMAQMVNTFCIYSTILSDIWCTFGDIIRWTFTKCSPHWL